MGILHLQRKTPYTLWATNGLQSGNHHFEVRQIIASHHYRTKWAIFHSYVNSRYITYMIYGVCVCLFSPEYGGRAPRFMAVWYHWADMPVLSWSGPCRPEEAFGGCWRDHFSGLQLEVRGEKSSPLRSFPTSVEIVYSILYYMIYIYIDMIWYDMIWHDMIWKWEPQTTQKRLSSGSAAWKEYPAHGCSGCELGIGSWLLTVFPMAFWVQNVQNIIFPSRISTKVAMGQYRKKYNF